MCEACVCLLERVCVYEREREREREEERRIMRQYIFTTFDASSYRPWSSELNQKKTCDKVLRSEETSSRSTFIPGQKKTFLGPGTVAQSRKVLTNWDKNSSGKAKVRQVVICFMRVS